MNIDNIYKAYYDCAIWSSADWRVTGAERLDPPHLEDVEFSLTSDFHESFKQDVISFCDANRALLDASGLTDSQIGHDFWLTRNHHGAGFWDRGIDEIGERLTEAAQIYPEVNLYIGDDGNLYF